MEFKIAPTDLTFLLRECPRCFWLKARKIRVRPYAPFPSMFAKIDTLQRLDYQNEVLEDGTRLDTTNRSLKTHFYRDGLTHIIEMNGKLDCLYIHPDNWVSVYDFKTSEPSPESVEMYKIQLHSYANMLENPAKNCAVNVRGLGLTYSNPDAYKHNGNRFALVGEIKNIPIEYDRVWFARFMDSIFDLLLGDEPVPGDKCGYCKWEADIKASLQLATPPDSKQITLIQTTSTQGE